MKDIILAVMTACTWHRVPKLWARNPLHPLSPRPLQTLHPSPFYPATGGTPALATGTTVGAWAGGVAFGADILGQRHPRAWARSLEGF